MFNYTIVWMKMVSYCQVNAWCRRKGNDSSNHVTDGTSVATGVQYPNNLTVRGKVHSVCIGVWFGKTFVTF